MPAFLAVDPMVSRKKDACYIGSPSFICVSNHLGSCPPLEKVLGYPEVWNGVVPELDYVTLVCGGLYLALSVKKLSFLPPESSPLCVWRTADCKHYLATKRAGVSWRDGWSLLITLMNRCSFRRKRKY